VKLENTALNILVCIDLIIEGKHPNGLRRRNTHTNKTKITKQPTKLTTIVRFSATTASGL
jgi:hypothetical protein